MKQWGVSREGGRGTILSLMSIAHIHRAFRLLWLTRLKSLRREFKSTYRSMPFACTSSLLQAPSPASLAFLTPIDLVIVEESQCWARNPWDWRGFNA